MYNLRLMPCMIRHEEFTWPQVNVSESDDSFTLSIEIPGVQKDDIKIWIENDLLVISGEKKGDDKEERFISERVFGGFERSFKLPAAIDRNKVTTKLLDGVLSINLPKVNEVKEIHIN